MILTCDPSFTAFGWAVVEKGKVIDYGCIQAKSSAKKVTDKDNERLTLLGNELRSIIEKYKITQIVSETSVGAKSYNAAKALNQCKGLMIGIASGVGVPLILVTPYQAKKSTLGNKNATKDEISTYITNKYDINFEGKSKFLREAVCDALSTLAIYEQINL